MKIGFIGLGIMGRPMAKNLLRAGHALTVCDHHPEHVAELAAAGARAADTPREAAAGNELVITMLPNSPNVREAVCGEGGVLEGAAPGTVLVDMSSIAPGASQEIAAACAEKGVKMLERAGERRRAEGGRRDAVDHGGRRTGGFRRGQAGAALHGRERRLVR